MISIVIPTFNEEKIISKCLDALVKQETKQEYEVIVSDNDSTDKTLQIVRKYKNKLDLKIVREKRKGRGAARWAGFRQAKGEIILSTDSDTVVPCDWIEKVTEQFKDKNIVAVTGTCRVSDCSRLKNTVLNISQPLFMIIYEIIFQHYWLSGFNFAIRKDIYQKAGEFNPDFNALEDIELSFKVKRLGKIQFISDLPVVMSGRRFGKGILKGALPYGQSFIGYRFRNKIPYMNDVR